MNKTRTEALSRAGIDPKQYAAFHIDRSQIPEGAEVVIQIRDRTTGELIDLPVQHVADDCFASHSQFFQQVMSDGHVFNPYIHRRFLPSQFQRNLTRYGSRGIHNHVNTNYGWDYVVRFLQSECWKLAMLEQRDPEAFAERSRFFTLDDMKRIFQTYAAEVIRLLDEGLAAIETVNHQKKKQVYYKIPYIGRIKKEHHRPMRYRFCKFLEKLPTFTTYAQLSEYLNSFKFCSISYKQELHGCFAACFLASGAYYTLKHKIMFEGHSLGGNSVTENLQKLTAIPKSQLMQQFDQ